MSNKIQPGKFEDRVGFIKQFTSQAASHLTGRGALQGIEQNERFSWKGGRARNLFAKEKNCSRQRFPLGGRGLGLNAQITSSSCGDGGGPCGRLPGTHQKTSDGPGKTTFLGEGETPITLGIKPGFGDLADTTLGPWVFSHTLLAVTGTVCYVYYPTRQPLAATSTCIMAGASGNVNLIFLNQFKQPHTANGLPSRTTVLRKL